MSLGSFVMAILLGVGGLTPSAARQPVSPSVPADVCAEGAQTPAHDTPEEQAVLGAISSVDRSTGLVTLETDTGRLEMAVPREELQGLREGDILVVCLGEEGPATEEILKSPFVA